MMEKRFGILKKILKFAIVCQLTKKPLLAKFYEKTTFDLSFQMPAQEENCL